MIRLPESLQPFQDRQLIGTLQLEKPHLLGHLMGCAIIWSYLDLFRLDEIDRLVLVDQSPLGILRSHWNAQETAASGAVFTAEQLNEAVYTLESSEAEEFTRNILASMVTPAISKKQFEWIVECNQRLPRALRRCCITIFIQTGGIKLSDS